MIGFTLTMRGTKPLLTHNARLADPLDPAAKHLKKLTGKRTKTDDDHAEVARAEFVGGLYLDPDVGPYLPGGNAWRCLQDGAKKSKRGVKVKEGLLITSDVNPIAYSGPRDAEGLWADANHVHRASVKVGTSRVMRCRPVFREWVVEFEGLLDPNILDFAELVDIATTAGQVVGIGDWRPRYGCFEATVTRS